MLKPFMYIHSWNFSQIYSFTFSFLKLFEANYMLLASSFFTIFLFSVKGNVNHNGVNGVSIEFSVGFTG